jgi:AcrR family transcriptional regulator
MGATGQGSGRARRLPNDERRRIVLDTATRLFTAHGVHAVGMDRLIAASGLGKMSVYRVFATKDELVGAYLDRLAEHILALIDRDIATAEDPRAALHAILDAIEHDLRRSDFRGCPFGNAAAEYDDRNHPARRVARQYRHALLDRLDHTARLIDPDQGHQLARQLAVLIDGAYLSTAHLGPDGPGAEGIALARRLIADA